MMTGPPTQAAILVSACMALCKSQPEKSEATRDDEADPAHPHRYRPVPDHDWPVHISRTKGNSATTAKITPPHQRTFSDSFAIINGPPQPSLSGARRPR